MRRLCAMILVCEAIVLALTIPVMISVTDTDPQLAGIGGGVLAVLAIALAGTLGRSWGVPVATGFQVLVLATGFFVPTMFILGVLFGALWGYAIWLGVKVEGRQAS